MRLRSLAIEDYKPTDNYTMYAKFTLSSRRLATKKFQARIRKRSKRGLILSPQTPLYKDLCPTIQIYREASLEMTSLTVETTPFDDTTERQTTDW